jgi:two-component system, sensor histidine kinase
LQLTRLLDELLDVNRISRGQFSIERNLIDVRDVILRAVESSRPLIDSRKHSIEVTTPDEPAWVEGDAVRLTQAVVNLLNNAAKYTLERGRIQLKALVRDAEIEIRVTDNGKGIDRDMLEKVFDLFVQVDPGSNETLGGLGVGLALVRRVLELHGGSVQARSDGNGHGAEFIARLPLSVQQIGAVAPTKLSAGDSSPKVRVLVVDDNKDSGDTLGLLLESMGQHVCTVYDGPSAVAAAQKFKPKVVLLDIGMPGMSGYEVARVISAMRSDSGPLLVAVTGWGQETDKERAKAAGFHHHFVKPISDDALRKIIFEAAGESPKADLAGG